MLVDNGLAQRILTNPGVLLVAGLTVIALIAERSLLGAGTLSGGALTPAWGGASALWHEYLQGFHPAGIGSASPAPPYVAVIAALATVLGGKPWLAIDVIMIGCIPLAGLTAFLALRRVTRSVLARVWAAAAYALLPVGMGAVAAGRFGSAVVFALIPLIALLAARIFTEAPRRARRAAWATGLVVAIAAAFVPLIWVVTVLGALLAAVAFRRAGRGMLLNLGITAVVPPVLLLPWTLQVATQPSLLFLEAGNKVPGLATAALPARSLLLLSPGGPGLPPFWVTGGLALAALGALLLTARRSLVMAGWSVALLGLLVSLAVSRMLLTTDDASKRVPGWPGISLAIAAGGLLLAAVVAADALPAQLGEGRWRRPAGLGVLILAAAACSAPLLAAGSWVATGVRGPAGGAAGPVLPPFVSVSSQNGARPRTLVLRAERGTVTYEVLRGADPLLGATDLTQPPAAQRTLDSVVSTLVAQGGGDAQDQGQALAALDIGYVLLPAPADAALAGTLNNVADLRPVSKTAGFQLWRVATTTARVRVAGPGGKLVAVPSGQVSVSGVTAPRAGGTLELAEPAGGWTATLNGTALQSVPSPAGAWAQAFRLPPGGGTLDISHAQLGRTLILVLEGLALLVVIGLGLPGARMPGESSAAAAARPAGRRRERGRDQAAEDLEEPGLEPESAPGREDAEPSRGGRLSRRAVATAGRTGTGRAGGLRTAADRMAGRPGRRAAAAGPGAAGPGAPGLSGPGPGAPSSGPGAGRRATVGASRRSARQENEDLTAASGAGPARDAGPDATAGSGADPAGWAGADAAGGFDPAGWAGGDRPAAVPDSSAGSNFWGPDDSPTVLGDRPAAPWEETGRPPGAVPAAAGVAATGLGVAEVAGAGAAGPGTAAGDGRDADRGGRKRWRLGRKAAGHNPPAPDAPEKDTGERWAGKRNPPEQESAAGYPPDPYASSGYRETAGTAPRRRGSGGASGPYPGPSGGSGERPSGAGRGRAYRGGADDRGTGEQGWDHTSADHAGAGYGGTGYDGAGDSGAGYGGAGRGRSDPGPDGYARTGYGGTGYSGSGPGSGEYSQPGHGGGRVSRGRLPGDDDLLPPPRRGAASGGYPAGAGVPQAGSRPGGPSYPDAPYQDAGYPDTPDHPGSAGPGAYPRDSSRSDPGRGDSAWGGYPGDSSRSDPGRGDPAWGGYPGDSSRSDPGRGNSVWSGYPDDSSRSDAGGGGSAWPSPDRSGSIWEPAPVRSGNPAGDYPGPDHPGTQHGDPDQGDLGHGDPGYDDPEYDPDSGSYSGTEFPGPDYPAPGDHSTSRAHAARGREWADEPGEGDW